MAQSKVEWHAGCVPDEEVWNVHKSQTNDNRENCKFMDVPPFHGRCRVLRYPVLTMATPSLRSTISNASHYA